MFACAAIGTSGIAFLWTSGGAFGWVLAAFLGLGIQLYVRPGPRDTRLLAVGVGSVAALAAAIVLIAVVGWESGEVVVVRFVDSRDETKEMRLWVVDLDGLPTSAISSGKWQLPFILRSPRVEFLRAGNVECRVPTEVPELREARDIAVEARHLFETKYGPRLYTTRILGFFVGTSPEARTLLVRFEPCPAETRGATQQRLAADNEQLLPFVWCAKSDAPPPDNALQLTRLRESFRSWYSLGNDRSVLSR